MAPKRKRLPENNALTYWKTAIEKIGMGTEQTSSFRSKGELIIDADVWGEALVKAEIQCMVDENFSAVYILNRIEALCESWYCRGYRFYLVPTCTGAPPDIESLVYKNKQVQKNVEESLIRAARVASDTWRKDYSSTIINKAVAAVLVEEAAAKAAAKAESKMNNMVPCVAKSKGTDRKRAHGNKVVMKSSRASGSSLATQSPCTVVPTSSNALVLPWILERLIQYPKMKVMSEPHECIRTTVARAFEVGAILRVWNRPGVGRELTQLDTTAHSMQRDLDKLGLQTVYGGSGGSKNKLDFYKVASGGFNSIWRFNGKHMELNNMLPTEVVKPFTTGKLVLRTPHVESKWLTFSEAVSEANNILITALTRCGPRVGALSFASKVTTDGDSSGGSTSVTLYKIYAFLENATQSVDGRFSGATTAQSSVLKSVPYYDSLLVVTYQFSYEGFVHLDATLRNFVDFYGVCLPTKNRLFLVKVIDVDDKCFRRLCPTETTEWRYLFLFNILSLLVYLKIRLAERWDASIHWNRVKGCCAQLLSDLDGTRNISSLLYWQGDFTDGTFFPDLSTGIYKGDSHEAGAKAAAAQLEYYLLQEPINEATTHYSNVLQCSKSTTAEVLKARAWYQDIYRKRIAPARIYFTDAFRKRAKPRRFVEVAFDFLDTSHSDLRKRSDLRVEHTRSHQPCHTRDMMLGIV